MVSPLAVGVIWLALAAEGSFVRAGDAAAVEKSANATAGDKAAGAANRQESAEAAPPAESAKPAPSFRPPTHKVKKGPFRIELVLDGTFEAQQMTEITLRPQEWSSFTVLSAVEHGRAVRRGDLLVALDTEKIDRAIVELRVEVRLAELSLKQAEQDLRALETTNPLDLAAAQRAHRNVSEDTQYYFDTARPMMVKSLNQLLKLYQQHLEYAEEELRQLEKMYKADEITEETEEIVLKRARNQVEMVRFVYERAKVLHEHAMKYELPRQDEQVRDVAQRANITWEKQKVVQPLLLEKQRLEFEKLKLNRQRAEERLNKLLADRQLMNVRAPVDGIVYYGSCERGRWTGGTGEELRRGSLLTANKVFMTVVQPRPMHVRAAVSERQLQHARAGLQGTVKPTAFPDVRLTAILERVAAVPFGSGSFDARISVAITPQAEALMPGMGCEVRFLAYENKEALTVPPAALTTDETDDQKHFVTVLEKDGKTRKQPVTVGKRSAQQVEILGGLVEGDEVLLEPTRSTEKEPEREKSKEPTKEPAKDPVKK
jgi:RND family efflux transporter MFP subunit